MCNLHFGRQIWKGAEIVVGHLAFQKLQLELGWSGFVEQRKKPHMCEAPYWSNISLNQL